MVTVCVLYYVVYAHSLRYLLCGAISQLVVCIMWCVDPLVFVMWCVLTIRGMYYVVFAQFAVCIM